MKKILAILATLSLAVALVAPTATAAPTSQELKGTWIGTYGGYEGTKKVTGGQEKLIITSVNSGVAQGTWQSRTAGDKWSKKSPLHLITYRNANGVSHISGSDATGTYVGTLSEDGELVLAYSQVSGLFLNLQIKVRKQ